MYNICTVGNTYDFIIADFHTLKLGEAGFMAKSERMDLCQGSGTTAPEDRPASL